MSFGPSAIVTIGKTEIKEEVVKLWSRNSEKSEYPLEGNNIIRLDNARNVLVNRYTVSFVHPSGHSIFLLDSWRKNFASQFASKIAKELNLTYENRTIYKS